jgi:hypothetical protein
MAFVELIITRSCTGPHHSWDLINIHLHQWFYWHRLTQWDMLKLDFRSPLIVYMLHFETRCNTMLGSKVWQMQNGFFFFFLHLKFSFILLSTMFIYGEQYISRSKYARIFWTNNGQLQVFNHMYNPNMTSMARESKE